MCAFSVALADGMSRELATIPVESESEKYGRQESWLKMDGAICNNKSKALKNCYDIDTVLVLLRVLLAMLLCVFANSSLSKTSFIATRQLMLRQNVNTFLNLQLPHISHFLTLPPRQTYWNYAKCSENRYCIAIKGNCIACS
jgi:hypothetical protein